MEYLLGNAWIWEHVEKHVVGGKGFVFVLGPTGIGKTHTMRQICIHHGIDAFCIDGGSCANGKELQDLISKQTTSRIVQELSDMQQPKCIVIDELETLIQYDRCVPSVLQTFSNSTMPIVCIGHKLLEKKLVSMFPTCRVYVCSAPSDTDICIWLKQYTNGSIPYNRILHISETCNGNIHLVMQMLHDKEPLQQTDDAITIHNVFDDLTRHQLMQILEDDPWLAPLRIHENLPSDLSNRKMTKDERERVYKSALQDIVHWDVMMQNNRTPSYALESIVSALMRVKSFPRRGICKDSHQPVPTEFTKLFSNLSLQKKNEKKMYSTDLAFPWIHAQIFCDYIRYK